MYMHICEVIDRYRDIQREKVRSEYRRYINIYSEYI